MTRTWTTAQESAITTRGCTLLISAAAGSGKTATLTERIIRRLTDPSDPVELSRLLVVTFTRAAAGELRERIGKALVDAIAQDPTNRHLRRQLLQLGSAHISTIDSFMLEPVKTHFAELGLPAKTRMADAAELLPLSERIMSEIMEEFYLKYATENDGSLFSLLAMNPFADLCDSLTSSKNDKNLLPSLRSLYEKLLAFPIGIERLKREAEALETGAEGDFFDTAQGMLLREWLGEFCASAEAALLKGIADTQDDEELFVYDLNFLHRISAARTYADAYALFATYEKHIMNKPFHTAICNAIVTLRDDYFSDTPSDLSEQMIATARMCRVLYDFLHTYDERILAEKQARGICDFTDNRRYMLRLLCGEDGTPTPVAVELAAQYDEVYIDEYQDVDELQDEIFRLVGGDHRFMVGDIKQSIYGFRGADPTVFARYRRDLPPLKEGTVSPNGNSIFMSDNFRCDESVIRVTNAVCGHILRACPTSVGYVAEDDLGFAKRPPSPEYRPTPVDVTVLTKPKKAKEDAADDAGMPDADAEATYVANRIASLLRDGDTLANGVRIRPRDIAILMRDKGHLSTYRRALSAMGIPVGSDELDAAEAGKDLLHGGDMMYLVNLLRVIDNPDNDIPLSEILRAPFPSLTLEEVLTVRRADDTVTAAYSLYECLEAYADTPNAIPTLCDKVADLLSWVEHYRVLCATQPAHGILRLLARDEHCACRETEAFRYLYDCARTCNISKFVSLSGFLRFFEKKLLTEKNAATATPNEGEDGHVSLLTIHKSKGLEFPVCFLVRTGHAFSAQSSRQDLIFEKTTGLSMKLYKRAAFDGASVQSQAKCDTTLRAVGLLAVHICEREEEMRLLYVAMTRARERLFIVGVGTADIRDGKFRGVAENDRYMTLTCSNHLQWVLSGLEAHPEVADFYRMTYLSTSDITPDVPLARRATATDTEQDAVAEYYRAIPENHTPPTQMDILLGRVPTKIPASRMGEKLLDTSVFYDTDLPSDNDGKLPDTGENTSWCDAMSAAAIRETLRLMRTSTADDVNEFDILLGENRRPTAAERGTAAHLFLQYADYAHVQKAGVDEEIARLCKGGFINDRTAEVLDRAALRGFFASDFMRKLQRAETVEREMKFHRFVPLSTLTDNAALAEALGDRTLSVQGSIDLLAVFPDGHIELCDYKTDRITAAERADRTLLAAHMKEKHGEQLRQYAAAVADMYGKMPTAVYIFSLSLGEAVEVDIS